MMPADQSEKSISLSAQETAALVALVQQELSEVHEELRRTEDFEFRDKMHERENILRNLLQKVSPAPVGAGSGAGF